MGKPDVEVKLDDINIEVSSDSTVDADFRTELVIPEPIRTESENRLIIPEPIETNIGLDVKPLRTESTFAITEPIVSENTSNIGLDIKPMTVDLCFKFDFGELPATCIRQPYQHHFGVTLFGIEIFGFNFTGESQTVIESIPKRPQVAWGGYQMVRQQVRSEQSTVQPSSSGGLRIKLDS